MTISFIALRITGLLLIRYILQHKNGGDKDFTSWIIPGLFAPLIAIIVALCTKQQKNQLSIEDEIVNLDSDNDSNDNQQY